MRQIVANQVRILWLNIFNKIVYDTLFGFVTSICRVTVIHLIYDIHFCVCSCESSFCFCVVDSLRAPQKRIAKICPLGTDFIVLHLQNLWVKSGSMCYTLAWTRLLQLTMLTFIIKCDVKFSSQSYDDKMAQISQHNGRRKKSFEIYTLSDLLLYSSVSSARAANISMHHGALAPKTFPSTCKKCTPKMRRIIKLLYKLFSECV